MPPPRRQLIRPAQSPANSHVDTDRQIHKLRSRLEAERNALARWMTRLRRAFNSVTKIQQHVARIERQIARLEGNHDHRA